MNILMVEALCLFKEVLRSTHPKAYGLLSTHVTLTSFHDEFHRVLMHELGLDLSGY